MSKKVNKTKLAKNLGICRQSLYYKPKLPAKDLKLKFQIEEVLKDHKAYGHKRIALKVPVKKQDIKQESVNNNLIKDLTIDKPSQIWQSDFTYLPYFNKNIYLATVIDCYSKEILGWNLSVKHNTDFIVQALLDSMIKRKPPKIFHCDQGSEYKSKELSKILKSNNIKLSMSAKSSPWQNGFQESFYGKFKLELGHPKAYENLGELTEAIALQIYYYNNQRIHTTLKMPPSVFYQNYQTLKAN